MESKLNELFDNREKLIKKNIIITGSEFLTQENIKIDDMKHIIETFLIKRYKINIFEWTICRKYSYGSLCDIYELRYKNGIIKYIGISYEYNREWRITIDITKESITEDLVMNDNLVNISSSLRKRK
jgi:hypothetical protein